MKIQYLPLFGPVVKRRGVVKEITFPKFLYSLNYLTCPAGTCPGLCKQRMRIDLLSHLMIRSLGESRCDLVSDPLQRFLWTKNAYMEKTERKKHFMCFLFKNQLDFVDKRRNTKKNSAVHDYSLRFKNRNDSILFYNILTVDIRAVMRYHFP